MANWRPYSDLHAQHTVTGDLRFAENIHSPQLNNERHLLVWLPPSYATAADRRYPVFYMHDGDNLFDANVSHSGEWQVDEAITALAAEGLEAIVVGIPNMGTERYTEYSPFSAAQPGKGDSYLDFITRTLKPLVDADFRTLPDAAHTGIAGSSMGGLISLYGFLTRPQVFGLCGSFSPVFWINGDALYQVTQTHTANPGRVYLDTGTAEGIVYANLGTTETISQADANDAYRDGVRRLRDGLAGRGYAERLLYVEDEGALHNEAAWAKRLPAALRFLLKGLSDQ